MARNNMNKSIIIIGIVAVLILGFALFNSQKQNNSNGVVSPNTEQTTQSTDIFKNMTNLCETLTKEQVSVLLGKTVVKTVPLTSGTLHSCQYYLNDSQAVIINNDFLNVADQKKGQIFLGRKITTNPAIPMDHFLVIQEDGLINEIYLVLGANNYVSINRTSAKILTEEEIISFASKLGGVITGKTPLQKTTVVSPTITQGVVPLPQETDIIRTFFNLIEERKISDAVMMMTSNITNDDSTKQAFGVQFAAMDSVKVTKIEESSRGDWTDKWHQYMVTLDVAMNPSSAGGPIPYYGFEKGENIRFITLIKEGALWKIEGLATGP